MALEQQITDGLENLHKASPRRIRKLLSPAQGAIVRQVARRRDVVVYTGSGDARYEHLLLPPLVTNRKPEPNVQAVIMTGSAETVRSTASRAQRVMGKQGPRTGRTRVVSLGAGEAPRKEAERIAESPDIVIGTTQRIIDHIRRNNLDLSRVRICVVDEPDEDEAGRFNADLEYIFSKIAATPQSVVFVSEPNEQAAAVMELLRRPAIVDLTELGEESRNGETKEHTTSQEGAPVYDQDYKHLFSDDDLKDWIKSVLSEIHDEEDPDEMDAYRKIIKKYVPFFRRGYFTAYLLKQLREKEGGGTSSRSPRRRAAAGGGASAGEAREGYKTMFVGVGKNRKVFPRDMIQLFSNVDGITGSDIGQIKILDNYSFVEITDDKAESAIAELNGKEYRGRKLNVNYARKKD
ncbi:MAG: DbpA RNA binding domain-containing protein [Spirochaetaceae bacterium]